MVPGLSLAWAMILMCLFFFSVVVGMEGPGVSVFGILVADN